MSATANQRHRERMIDIDTLRRSDVDVVVVTVFWRRYSYRTVPYLRCAIPYGTYSTVRKAELHQVNLNSQRRKNERALNDSRTTGTYHKYCMYILYIHACAGLMQAHLTCRSSLICPLQTDALLLQYSTVV
jgi:hypothetical protein